MMPEQVDIAAILGDAAVEAAEQELTFMGAVGTRLPGTEAVDVRALLRAAIDAATREAQP